MTALPQPRKGAVAFVIGGLALALLATSFGARFWRLAGAPPLPALLEGLEDSRRPGSQQAFRARLEPRFPVGAPGAALVDELRAQGFGIGAGEATSIAAPGSTTNAAAAATSAGPPTRAERSPR